MSMRLSLPSTLAPDSEGAQVEPACSPRPATPVQIASGRRRRLRQRAHGGALPRRSNRPKHIRSRAKWPSRPCQCDALFASLRVRGRRRWVAPRRRGQSDRGAIVPAGPEPNGRGKRDRGKFPHRVRSFREKARPAARVVGVAAVAGAASTGRFRHDRRERAGRSLAGSFGIERALLVPRVIGPRFMTCGLRPLISRASLCCDGWLPRSLRPRVLRIRRAAVFCVS